jgi:hypothetical protein
MGYVLGYLRPIDLAHRGHKKLGRPMTSARRPSALERVKLR